MQDSTFVCQHLVESRRDGKARGFWWAEDPGNPRPDAWCTACNNVVASENGEWTPVAEAFAKVKLLCGGCYDRVRSLNRV